MFGAALPIIQAPMAGGSDTPELAAAVSSAGGLGSLGCTHLAPADLLAAAQRVRALTSHPFAINLFAGGRVPDDPAAPARLMPILDAFRAELSLPLSPPVTPRVPSFDDQLAAVLEANPAVFSFTFGIPAPQHLAELRKRDIAIVGTATTVEEARALDDAGVDAICAQGSEAGGHRGTFLGSFDDGLISTLALVPQIVAVTRRPVIAAGGIMTGAGIRAVLHLGAAAAQLGTAFLGCPEAGITAAYRAALSSGTRTTITSAFSGRPARGIVNRMTDTFAPTATPPAPFPQHQFLISDIRRAAAAQGRTDLMYLLAGQGAPLVRTMPAAQLVATLAGEAGLS